MTPRYYTVYNRLPEVYLVLPLIGLGTGTPRVLDHIPHFYHVYYLFIYTFVTVPIIADISFYFVVVLTFFHYSTLSTMKSL